MLRFNYEGQTYTTEEYSISRCGAFWLVPAILVSAALSEVMDDLIIPYQDGHKVDENNNEITYQDEVSASHQRLVEFRRRVLGDDPAAHAAFRQRQAERERQREAEREERGISFSEQMRERLQQMRERQRQAEHEERQRQAEHEERLQQMRERQRELDAEYRRLRDS